MLNRPVDCIFCLLKSRYEDIKKLGIEDKELYKKIIRIAETIDNFRTQAFSKSFSLIVRAYGGTDPYKDLKEEYTKIAMEIISKIKVKTPSEGLRFATIFNTFDTSVLGYEFNPKDISLNGDFLIDQSFILDGLSGKRIAYILDNAGEHVFDLKTIELLRDRGNIVDIFVRSDAYEIDVIAEDLRKNEKIIETPGNLPPAFMRDFSTYDLVISKGIANLEAAIESFIMGYGIDNFIFAFKAKCTVLKSIFKADGKDLIIASWKTIKEYFNL